MFGLPNLYLIGGAALVAASLSGFASWKVSASINYTSGYSSGVTDGRKQEHAAQLEVDNDATGKARRIRDRINVCELELGGVWDETRKACSK